MQQESVSQISKKVSNLFFKLQCDQMDTKGTNRSVVLGDSQCSGSSNRVEYAMYPIELQCYFSGDCRCNG